MTRGRYRLTIFLYFWTIQKDTIINAAIEVYLTLDYEFFFREWKRRRRMEREHEWSYLFRHERLRLLRRVSY